MFAAAALAIGCGSTTTPTDSATALPTTPPVRELIFWVQNDSPQAQVLTAATIDDVVVGTTVPAQLRPRSRILVTLTAPRHEGWALYLEPAQQNGQPLLYGADFRHCYGPISVEINIDRDGNPGWSTDGDIC